MNDHGLRGAIDWLLLPSSVALITATSFPLLMVLAVGESRPALQAAATALGFLSGLAWRVRLGFQGAGSKHQESAESHLHLH